MTLSELIAAFLADQTRGHSAETLKGHKSKLGQLRRHLGDWLQVATISRADIKRWQEDMFDRNLSPWTIKTTYNCARQFFRWAVVGWVMILGLVMVLVESIVGLLARRPPVPSSSPRAVVGFMLSCAIPGHSRRFGLPAAVA